MKHDITKLKPFDLEKAKNGYPVSIREGTTVVIYDFEAEPSSFPIIGKVILNGRVEILSWSLDGIHPNHEKDLMMVPKTVTKYGRLHVETGTMYDKLFNSTEELLKYFGINKHDYRVVKVEWEE